MEKLSSSYEKEERIRELLGSFSYPESTLHFLGSGAEGCVYETDDFILKYFPRKSNIPVENLRFIKEKMCRNPEIRGMRQLIEILETETELLFISPNEHCTPYLGGDEFGTLGILADAYQNRYVHLNFNPSNLMYTKIGKLELVDLGADVAPFSDLYFQNMVERAFLTTYRTKDPNLKEIMSKLHTDNRKIDETGLAEYNQKLTDLIRC